MWPRTLSIFAGIALAAAPASGLMISVSLDAAQEIPTPAVAGFTPTGSAVVDVDTTSGAVSISGSYSGMTSSVVGSHLHGLTGPSPTAGVLIALTNTGATAGSFSGSGTLSGPNLAGLLDGRTYLNLHTANNPAGEIRGNVVPEPGTAVLLALGCVGLAKRRSRRD